MAAINRVGHVVLYVSDVSAAVDFYRDAMVMETVEDPDELEKELCWLFGKERMR